MNIDLKKLRALLKTLDDGEVTEFEFEDNKTRFRIARGTPQAAMMMSAPVMQATLPAALPGALGSPAVATTPDVAAHDPNAITITSPFVGTFYRAPSPDAPHFVEVGSTIREGQTLCIIEAMKLMNEIEAETSGVVKEILVENGKSVEFDQPLFRIAKS
jgi:acetyl-CoA carboxylase biotin carboxyl carrier protein